MEKWELDEKITGASKTILSYCMAHTSTSYDAEDLAQEIILEIYKSSADIRDDRAFYGFLWAVAKNVYRQWCRRNKRDSYCELIAAEEDYILDRLEDYSCIQIADKVKSALDEKEPEIRKIGFYGADMEQNSFAWQISCILLHYAIIEKLQNRVKLQYPVDKFGQACFVWGQERYEDERDAGSFRFGHCEVSNQRGDRIFFMDFGINGEFLHHIFFNRQDYTNVLLELAEGRTDGFGENDRIVLADLVKRGIAGNSSGKLCLNMPVFTVDQMKRLEGIFEPVSDEIAAEAGNLMEEIRAILKNNVPTHLKKTAKDLAYFRILENCISKPIEKLNREKYLLPAPDGAMLPTTYVLISGKSISE